MSPGWTTAPELRGEAALAERAGHRMPRARQLTRRVLIVSLHFPPDSSTAGTHRVRLLAPHLEAYGWEPTVLTVDPRDYDGPLDDALGGSVPAAMCVVRVRVWPLALTRPLGVGDLGLTGVLEKATACVA